MKEFLEEEIQISGPVDEAQSEILTREALGFLTRISRKFEERRQQLLQDRCLRQQRIDQGRCRISSPKLRRYAKAGGRWLLSLPTWQIVGLKSPAPPIGK